MIEDRLSDVHYVMVGKGVDANNQELVSWIRKVGLEHRFCLLGRRNDVARLMSSLDVAVSSSRGESFPNVVGEAMACAVPCVVTDVGDSAMIVGDTGQVVSPNNPKALAKALERVTQLDSSKRRKLGRLARQRIVDRYSMEAVVRQYESMYRA
jgi:glycosyltransferase involved in cell wall biosynthesis